MHQRPPLAFLSYATINDKHDQGKLTEFCQRLSAEVQVHTGEEFPIFQDQQDIQWGQAWEPRLTESLDQVTFLIPIVTPSFFKSQWCRDELDRFLAREKALKRNDLVLPVYYVECPSLKNATTQAQDPLAEAIARHQIADWRELRFEPFTNPLVGKTLACMAVQIRDALERLRPPTVVMPPTPDSPTRPLTYPPIASGEATEFTYSTRRYTATTSTTSDSTTLTISNPEGQSLVVNRSNQQGWLYQPGEVAKPVDLREPHWGNLVRAGAAAIELQQMAQQLAAAEAQLAELAARLAAQDCLANLTRSGNLE